MPYLDHNASSPLRPEVLEAMLPFFTECAANPASAHRAGWLAVQAVEEARARITRLLGGADEKKSIVFTSGTTESNNLALRGVEAACEKRPAHFISQMTEHACILESLRLIQEQGHEVTLLPVDSAGRVCPDDIRAAIQNNTVLISIMHANNETGTINDITAMARIAHAAGILFHTDAAQSIGKIELNAVATDADLISFSGHKIGGPKGVGGLYIAPRQPRIRIHPLIIGGGHEGGLRSGTLNVPAILGMARTLEVAEADRVLRAQNHANWLHALRIRLHQNLPDIFFNTPGEDSLPNTLNVGFSCVRAEELIIALPELAFATGAACASHSTEPSHVLLAQGRTREQAQSSVRMSLGWNSCEADVISFAEALLKMVPKLRERSPEWQMQQKI